MVLSLPDKIKCVHRHTMRACLGFSLQGKLVLERYSATERLTASMLVSTPKPSLI